jgi:predicted DNA-binding transcriptional regulator AlpA
MMINGKRYMTAQEIADAHGVTRRTVYSYMGAGKFPTVKWGKERLTLAADYDAFRDRLLLPR